MTSGFIFTFFPTCNRQIRKQGWLAVVSYLFFLGFAGEQEALFFRFFSIISSEILGGISYADNHWASA